MPVVLEEKWPVLGRHELAVGRLRIWGDLGRAPRTIDAYARGLRCTPQWLAKVENFDKPPSEGLADDLDTFFNTAGAFHRLWEQMVEARKQGLIPSGFRPLARAERDAMQLFIFAPLLIPGVLQTPELARLVLESEQRPEKAEQLLAVRMERQTIFAKPEPPALFVLLREAVIRTLPVESREGQCKQLLDVMSEPNVSIQIIPTRARVFQGSGFQLLSFEAAADVAYVDGAGANGQMLTEPSAVRRLAILFNMIRSKAISAEESEDLIHSIMEGA